ncbi:hypothetical protein FACS1894111_10310 [Clostridia bacterium]|nr:hypothetical protein FACS1894111_10310 [Clostridia bacterium]
MKTDNSGVKRDNSGKFATGTAKPKNAGRGRKKTPPDIKAAFEELSHSAVDVLRKILNDTEAKPSDRLRAAECVLDRHLGKPQQSVDLSAIASVTAGCDDVIDLSVLTDDELGLFGELYEKASTQTEMR